MRIANVKIITVSALLLFSSIAATARQGSPRHGQKLEKGWKFTKGDPAGAMEAGYDDSLWEDVRVPHDWAIYGPFDSIHDAQNVAIVQNLEEVATLKTGRTGGLPYIGVGWYRRELPDFGPDETVTLLFDGAMSEARVYVNGQEACFWPYGYNSFHCDITPYLVRTGGGNSLAVRLENLPESSRWYPGAGLYRNVHVITTHRTHIPVWGTYITTPETGPDRATVRLEATVQGCTDRTTVSTVITDLAGNEVAASDGFERDGERFVQWFRITEPDLWSPENPALYFARTYVYENGALTDSYTTRFGIRSIEFIPDRGFFLNGEPRKIQGVCNHHDLGPLGAAVNTAALRRQLTMLKDMGCDAVRTAHNMPAPELVALCDEMGLMVMVEPFDEWDIAKCRNGYHRYFHEWAEKDMVNMLHNFRNNPSVVMWSIGNEVPSQCAAEGYLTAAFLRGICHREDPTRPVTCGMDQVKCVIGNGFAEQTDIPGFNYRVHLYEEAYDALPQKIVLGAETSSTFSSRGVYKFPVVPGKNVMHPDQQCSSYDLECASWSNLPDEHFAMVDDHDWNIGQFVWTGFDYLGEPTPYDRTWPNHSSMFGIIDLASIPKDRYWLYRSQWNRTEHTLHLLPHWNWEGREGEVTPVYVYTDLDSAELFINGRSQGVRTKNGSSLQHRYRLMWEETVYEPGEVTVVAYDGDGREVMSRTVRTAGEPHRIVLTPDRTVLDADGNDLCYINVKVTDREGNPCPRYDGRVHFEVSGEGSFRAAANGDPTCLDLFHLPEMPAFSGQLTAIVQSSDSPGKIRVRASAEGLEDGEVTIGTE